MSIQKTAISPLWLITVVAVVSMLAPFSIDTYLPSFPAIEQDLQVSRQLLTQSLAIYLGVFALSTLFWGPLADRFGRRKVVLSSLIGYLFAALLCALAQDFQQLMVGRALQGVMAAGSLVASRAMIRDYFSGARAQSALAVVMMLFTVAPAIAPIIGGYLEVHFGWRSVFYFLAFYALVLWLMFAWQIAETQDPEHVQSIHPKQLLRSYTDTLKHPLFLRLALLQGLLIGGFFIYVASSASLIYEHLGWQEQDFWRLFIPMVGGILLGSMLSHRLAEKTLPIKLVSQALLIAFVAIAINSSIHLIGDTSAFWAIAPLSVYALGFALANPGLSVLGLDCLPNKRGMAASLQSLMQMGTAALVTALIVPWVEHSLLAMALAQAAMLVIAVLLWWSLHRRPSFQHLTHSH
jgi:DHA1 family bicyclomycin/chloramphenicol resistance-like MFS transporter